MKKAQFLKKNVILAPILIIGGIFIIGSIFQAVSINKTIDTFGGGGGPLNPQPASDAIDFDEIVDNATLDADWIVGGDFYAQFNRISISEAFTVEGTVSISDSLTVGGNELWNELGDITLTRGSLIRGSSGGVGEEYGIGASDSFLLSDGTDLYYDTGVAKLFLSDDLYIGGIGLNDTGVAVAGATKIGIPVLGTPTYTTQEHFNRLAQSAGRISGGEITDNGDGTVAVAAGTGFIKATDSDVAELLSFDWVASSSVANVTDDTVFIGINYNSGSPKIVSEITITWDYDTTFPLGSIVDVAGHVDILNNPWWVGDSITNVIERTQSFGWILRDSYIGGLIISQSGTRNLDYTAGTMWSRLNEREITASTAAGFETYYRDGSGSWIVEEDIFQWSVEDYDTGVGTLTSLSAGRYANIWVFMEWDGQPAIVYPQNQYTVAATAEAEEIPSVLPEALTHTGLLLGRILIKDGTDAPVQVQSAFVTQFTAAQAADHANLANLTFTTSGHTGTADTFAGFDGTGAATEYTESNYLLADGTRALTGDWAMGAYNLTGGSLISFAHASVSNDLTIGSDDISFINGVASISGTLWVGGALTLINDSVQEEAIDFNTACAAGNHYYLNGNDLACEADDDTTYTATAPLQLNGTAFTMDVASTSGSGYLSNTLYDDLIGHMSSTNEHLDWTADQGATDIHAGNYTDTNTTYTSSAPIYLEGTNFRIELASTSGAGYLSSTDWDTFNAKLDSFSATNPLSFDGSTLTIDLASASGGGYLAGTDFADFAGHMASVNEHLDWTQNVGTIDTGNYIENPFGASIGEGEMDIATAPQDNYILFYNSAESKLDYITATSSWDTDTTYTASGTLLDLTSEVFSINEGTLTDDAICNYDTTGTQIECTITDNSANWNTAFSWGDFAGNFVSKSGDTMTGNLNVDAIVSISDGFEGAGLSDCDNATTSKLLWDATGKIFSCGTDQTGAVAGLADIGNVATSSAADNEILSYDSAAGVDDWINQTPAELGLIFSGGTLTDTQLCVADGTSGAIDCNIAQTYYVADGCSDCLNATEIEDIYFLTAGDEATYASISSYLTIGDNDISFVGGVASISSTLWVGGAITGALTGNASTATALADNGGNCNAGEYALGVDASGAVESCTDATTEINSVVNGLGGTNLTCSGQSCNVDDVFFINAGDIMVRASVSDSLTVADILHTNSLVVDAGVTIINNSIDEADVKFSTACAAGNHYYLSGDDLACEADATDDSVSAAELTIDYGDFTCNGTTCTIDASYLLDSGDIGTGVYDFGGADSFEIPNAANGTVDADGEITFDTTENQLVIYGGGDTLVFTASKSYAWGIASGSADRLVDGSMLPFDYTITQGYCRSGNVAGEIIIIDVYECSSAGVCGEHINTASISCDNTAVSFVPSDTAGDTGDFYRFKIHSVNDACESTDQVIVNLFGSPTRK